MRAIYFDGVSAQRRPAEAVYVDGVLSIHIDGGETRAWHRCGFEASTARGRGVLLIERLPARVESLLIEDPAAAAQLNAMLGKARSRHGLWLQVAVFLLPALLLFGVIYASFPYAVGAIARIMPKSMEQRLGRAVYATLAPPRDRLQGAAIEEPMRGITLRLAEVAEPGYPYQTVITRSPQVNAWAAPGGYIAIYCGLVHQLESGDELAAILAHEFTHVARRHTTRSLVRNVALRIAVSFIGGGTDAVFDTAGLLGALHLMRSDEAEADAGALTLLAKASIDPRALAQAFGRLEHAGPDMPGALRYLSTHPPTAERAALAERMARQLRTPTRPVLSRGEWLRFQQACHCK